MENELVTFVSPKKQTSEIFRTLRTNIQFMDIDGKHKSLLITSTVPGEGKSWVTSNLAITFAQAGKRVLIVDADMRKGRQHEIFDLKGMRGLSNYLITATEGGCLSYIGDYIQQTMVENLYVMSSGMIPPNPSELLSSQKMVDLIEYLEKVFDIVIFDGTPSTVVTDAIILSKFVDSTIIVAAHKITRIDDLNRVKKNIQMVGGNIAGVVLNKMPSFRRKSKNGYYYESEIVPAKKYNNKIIEKLITKTIPAKKIEDEEIKEVNKKLSTVKSEKTKSEPPKKEEVDVNSVLEQLSQIIADGDKK